MVQELKNTNGILQHPFINWLPSPGAPITQKNWDKVFLVSYGLVGKGVQKIQLLTSFVVIFVFVIFISCKIFFIFCDVYLFLKNFCMR